MEINEFARTILFGTSLEDKLISNTGAWSDHIGFDHSVNLSCPGRPKYLSPVIQRQGKFEFPKISQFTEPKQRGKALHYFANHELEAMELMALALLKFQDAPKNYRLALAGIITEEQRHFKLYLNRMRELGVELGEFPVSGFFWQSLSQLEDLKKFTAAMNLTLEQANLDHCLFFKDLFIKVDDLATSKIMDEVLKDEVGHVKHGLNWFNKWRSNDLSLWHEYQQDLPVTLSPSRARGKIFNREIRSAIGFDKNFIDSLEVFSQSKGRVPDLYYFYPFVEYELALGPHGINIPKKTYQIKTDLETIPMFLAKTDDMVLVAEKPRQEFLQSVKSAGFEVPEFVVLNEELKKSSRRIKEFRPWGWCYHTKRLAKKLSDYVEVDTENKNKIDYYYSLYAKSLAINVLKQNSHLCDSSVVGVVVESEDEVLQQIQLIKSRGHSNVVIKAILGSSGQNQIRLSDKLDDQQVLWLRRLLKEQKQVIVEPWLDRQFDFSIQIKILPDGRCKFMGYSRFICDQLGKYRGTWVGGFETNLSKEQVLFIHKGNRLKEITKCTVEAVSKELNLQGYNGVAGIDCFVYRDLDGDLQIKPVVEVNVRNNMGEITTKLTSRVLSRQVGMWLILSLPEIKSMGFSNFSTYAEYMKSLYPLEFSRNTLIQSGILFTSDPVKAVSYCGVLAVGQEAVNKLSNAALKSG